MINIINLDVDYPYISMIKKYKSQYIIEGCGEHNNFKIIIHTDNLFEEEIIDIQKTAKNYRPCVLSFFDLYILYDISFTTSMELYRRFC